MLGPFVWGESDCCLAVCNVLRDWLGVDPAADFRGRYADEAGARAFGTVLGIATRICETRGWPEVQAPADGDVGVLGKSLVIRCGGRWWGKIEEGYVMTTRPAMRAWRPL